MTIQWMLVASFLYFELGLIVLLILPFISPKLWCSLFHFHLWKSVAKKANVYFNVLIFVLILFFLDSIRDMMRYATKSPHSQFDAELQTNVKLFRSQRNYYISGFAVFLWLVIRRLVILLLTEAELLIKNEEATKKAQGSTEHLEKLRKSLKEEAPLSTQCEPNLSAIKEIKNLKQEIEAKKSEAASIRHQTEELAERDLHTQHEYEVLLLQNKALKCQTDARQ